MSEQTPTEPDSLHNQSLPSTIQLPASNQNPPVISQNKWITAASFLCLGLIIFDIYILGSLIREELTTKCVAGLACGIIFPYILFFIFDIFLLSFGGIAIKRGRLWGANLLFIFQILKIPFSLSLLLGLPGDFESLPKWLALILLIDLITIIIFFKAKKELESSSKKISPLPNADETSQSPNNQFVAKSKTKLNRLIIVAISLIILAPTAYQLVKTFTHSTQSNKYSESASPTPNNFYKDKYYILVVDTDCRRGCSSDVSYSNSEITTISDHILPSTHYNVTVCNSYCSDSVSLPGWIPKKCLSNKNGTITINIKDGSCY